MASAKITNRGAQGRKRFSLTKWLILIISLVILVPVLGFAGLIGFSALTEYLPEPIETARWLNQQPVAPIKSGEFQVTTYNIGYGGMDAGQDFFMDGGTMSRSKSLEKTQENMASFVKFIKETQSDAYFLQEVDENATRSQYMNQVAYLEEAISDYSGSFAYNYKAKWVPVPWTEPMGKTDAGLVTFSRTQAESGTRYQLPGYEAVPTRYVDLKRCVMTNTYPVDNGKTLYLVNVHLSAFDKGGVIRAQQLEWLIQYMTDLYDPEKNYVVLGGDWNHLMSQAIFDRIVGEPESWIAVLPETLTDTGFELVYDDGTNSVRSAVKPYVAGENFETIIDGFLVSPNVEVVSVKTHDLKFANSDHQPVTAIFKFE